MRYLGMMAELVSSRQNSTKESLLAALHLFVDIEVRLSRSLPYAPSFL
jgi:hypothetical protein